MKLNHESKGHCKLGDLVSRKPNVVFMFNGYTYMTISKLRSDKVVVTVRNGTVPCINLKSHSIRGLPTDSPVIEMDATVNLAHSKIED